MGAGIGADEALTPVGRCAFVVVALQRGGAQAVERQAALAQQQATLTQLAITQGRIQLLTTTLLDQLDQTLVLVHHIHLVTTLEHTPTLLQR